MATLDGAAGFQKLLDFGTYNPGWCLEAVSKALGAYWLTSDRPGYYTYALRAWETVPESERRYTRDVPKGAVLYWSASSNGFGHIAISGGGNIVASTDIPRAGQVGLTTIEGIEKAWGRKFLGWTTHFMGHTIEVAGKDEKPLATQLKGVDVSSWQPARVLRDISDYDFAIVKATGGPSFVSSTCNQQVADAVAKGKRVGLYHFALDGFANRGARVEADHFVDSIKGLLKHKPILVLDWEAQATSLPVSWAVEFIERVRERTGQTCVFYSYANYVQNTDLSEIVQLGCWLWIASYGPDNRRSYSEAPSRPRSGSWPSARLFQFTQTGRLSGYNGQLDLNIFYGSSSDWDKYAGGSPATAKPVTGGGSTDVYTVRAGDTLSGIAGRYGTTYQELARINGISNPDRIYVGQTIRLKGGSAPSAPSSGTKYTVKRGDTLSGIANRYGTTVAAIQAENSVIKNPDHIQVGWTLTIPGKSSSSSRTHTVKRGENLSVIANQHGTTVANLVRKNGISNPDLIHPGQALKL